MRKELTGEARSWAIAGHGKNGLGNLAKEAIRQLGKPEVAERLCLKPKAENVFSRYGVMSADGETKMYESVDEISELPDVLFVTMPSADDGEAAYQLISRFLKEGKTVVTAEKGALANNFSALKKQSNNFRRLGIDTTVGGGTHLMRAAEMYCRDLDNISEIHLALNGTLNALFSSIAPPDLAGMSLGQAVDQAVRLGFADSPEDGKPRTPYDVIRDEAERDVPKKVAIFFNYLGFGKVPVGWRDLIGKLSDEEIDRAIEDASNRRFIVSIYPQRFQKKDKKSPESDIIGKLVVPHEGWTIVSGFRRIKSNPFFFPLGTLMGAKNGGVVAVGPDESDGDFWPGIGPGAGPSQTVNAMIDDYVGLRRQQQMLDDYVEEVLQRQN